MALWSGINNSVLLFLGSSQVLRCVLVRASLSAVTAAFEEEACIIPHCCKGR